uniref:Uncharacterized protein n=1 Tax=Spongospora subterranea TaxID=70186 RepID=A0A0H5R323_9EUKA|eukprot:CRZ08593.1 hypothetical protein [Spongospora subterranea]
MDLSFANKYNIQIKPTRSPLTVSGFNRHKVVIGHETEPVQIQLGGFLFETSFLVVNNLSFPILLGYSWLMEHNPTCVNLPCKLSSDFYRFCQSINSVSFFLLFRQTSLAGSAVRDASLPVTRPLLQSWSCRLTGGHAVFLVIAFCREYVHSLVM